MKCVDLFCGAGGLSEGFREEGFGILVANDFDQYCEQTYRANHPDTHFISGRIQDITPEQILDICNLEVGELDCVIGGPPCQAFSVYNHQRGMQDERSGLFREYLRIVAGLLPRFVVMENVPGMSSVENGIAVDEIQNGLESLGYNVKHDILKAEEYGVPQERRRLIFLGTKLDADIAWPEKTHGTSKIFKPYVNVWDAISDLPILQNGEGTEVCAYEMPARNDYQSFLRKGSLTIYNHVAPSLGALNLQRLKYIPQGGSWRDIPFDLLPSGMKRAKRSDHTKRYGRLSKDGFASTILTKCDPHWGAFFHPIQDRVITVREAARLQCFPDRIQFCGSRSDQYKQVGNAVPVFLSAALARAVKKADEAYLMRSEKLAI
jgi:DNA (cytosine-5)-methyltransferase 1